MNVRTPEEERSEQAAFWLARSMSEQMSSSERLELANWLNADHRNAAAYHDLRRLEPLFDEVAYRAAISESINELHELSKRSAKEKSWRRIAGRFVSSPQVAAIAACVAACAVFVSAITSIFPSQIPAAYQTAVGEQRTVAIEDGSVVHINTNSVLDILVTKSSRVAHLRNGEALFEVEKDPSRPFIVSSGAIEIRVTGTKFNVLEGAHLTEVSVIEGTVNVYESSKNIATLAQGERVTLDKHTGKINTSEIPDNDEISWIEGRVKYRDEPLIDVIEDLNRYYKKNIVLVDARIHQIPVTGEFDLRNQNSNLDTLSVAFSLDVSITPHRIELRKAEN